VQFNSFLQMLLTVLVCKGCQYMMTVKAKFHYASWFGAGSKLDPAEIWLTI